MFSSVGYLVNTCRSVGFSRLNLYIDLAVEQGAIPVSRVERQLYLLRFMCLQLRVVLSGRTERLRLGLGSHWPELGAV